MSIFNDGLNRLKASLADSSKAMSSNYAIHSNSGDVFIKVALEQLTNAKEAKKLTALRDACKTALTALEATTGHPNPSSTTLKTIFTPFQLACQSRQPALVSVAIDCLGKLFPYNYWGKPDDGGDIVDNENDSSEQVSIAGSATPPQIKARNSAESQKSNSETIHSSSTGEVKLISMVVENICDSFTGGDSTDEKVQLQIVKSLSSAIFTADPNSSIHGGVLLKAIRTTYNIFLFSKTPNTQMVAQTTLAQMVQAVFSRIPENLPPPPIVPIEGNSRQPSPTKDNVVITSESDDRTKSPKHRNSTGQEKDQQVSEDLQKSESKSSTIADESLNKQNDQNIPSPDTTIQGSPSVESVADDDTATTSLKSIRNGSPVRKSHDLLNDKTPNNTNRDTSFDIFFKDAYLVFRALCKLSMKAINTPEGATDIKSPGMRSKLLALHLIHSTLSVYSHVFHTPAPVLFSQSATISQILFIHAVKQHLCLALSRNSASVVPQVFDVSMEIFGKVLVSLRTILKKELAVIFTEIILPIVEAKNTVTYYQRLSSLINLVRTLSDPNADGGRVLVELYLNYDCDVEAGAKENIWERLLISLAKITSFHPVDAINSPQSQTTPSSLLPQTQSIAGLLPAFTSTTLNSFTKEQIKELYSANGDHFELKKRSLELLVQGILKPLLTWTFNQKNAMENDQSKNRYEPSLLNEIADPLKSISEEGSVHSGNGYEAKPIRRLHDDPLAFENLKQKKQIIVQGVRQFNAKPKKGIKFLLESGCIQSSSPNDIAKFLISVEGFDKKALGEYLGEGDEENIAIMHAFVDELEFANLPFVDALRQFLQTFRLPGEAQKIDRFMLKFAERYLTGNPQSFTSADTAYVLAYSVIMLNTDLHNAQVKKKMVKTDFIKNNRGIDGGKDLPPEYLQVIYDEIASNEIVMNDEQALKATAKFQTDGSKPKSGLAQVTIASEAMVISTEAKFNHLMKNSKNAKKSGSVIESTFYAAYHYEHVKAMFQLIWMSVLTSLSGPLQESDDQQVILLSMEGFKSAIRICCMFDMDLERQALVSTLAKVTQLNRVEEMKTKNLEAIRTLLEVAFAEGNYLSDSWIDIITCISQLERFQLLGSDGEEELQRIQRQSSEHQTRQRRESNIPGLRQPEMTPEASSQSLAIAVDKIFTSTTKLSGTAIVEFVKALCSVSWEEITASADREHPKMYSLQRLVEISYYNMRRIRVEWSNIWAVLGEHFNQVGSHPNSTIAFFALDKLRQLAMKFLEIEELPNFKFQKDFLRPFEYVMGNANDVKIKDMVLACLQQMIQAKSKSMKSGWKAILAAFTKAAKESSETISQQSFDIVKGIFKNNFESIVANSSFSDFIACLVEFCKNKRFVKTSLQAVEIVKASIPRMVELGKSSFEFNSHSRKSIEDGVTPVIATTPGGTAKVAPDEDPNFKFWFPILFGLYEIIMTCELEVRARGLAYLFETLKQYGDSFPKDFWEVIAKGVLFPIFDDLKMSNQEQNKSTNREDLSVWMSTTLIQALRLFVDLFSFFFDTLQFLLDGALDLLVMCLTQDNEALARIGSTCTHQFIESNATKFNEDTWDKISLMFTQLFEKSTPSELFFDLDDSPDDAKRLYENQIIAPVGLGLTEYEALKQANQDAAKQKPKKKRPEKKDFQKIIMKCVLHLLLIQTMNEILNSTSETPVYPLMKTRHLFLLLDCLERSYIFARDFNGNLDLRTNLYRMGFMKQMPNLLKQETSSISTFIQVLNRMYSDPDSERVSYRKEITRRLIPLNESLLLQFNELDPEAKKRDVATWRPVILIILNGLAEMEENLFKENLPKFYEPIVSLLAQELPPDFRLVLLNLFTRAGITFRIVNSAGEPASPITDNEEYATPSLPIASLPTSVHTSPSFVQESHPSPSRQQQQEVGVPPVSQLLEQNVPRSISSNKPTEPLSTNPISHNTGLKQAEHVKIPDD